VGPILDIENLTKSYGSTTAVDNVSLTVNTGEFLCIIGPSGCGKSTLLRMIAGFIEPTSGDIRLDGQTILALPPYRRPVNMVFQNYALFPHLTVGQNVAFGMEMRKFDRSESAVRVRDVLKAVELEGFESRSVLELSGGQQQRVALARALVLHPRVLLLDEPLGALDQKVRRKMQVELMRIHREVGITFVHVTHDQEEALAMSDRIAVMSNGRIEQLGDRVEVYTRPRTPFVADFVGESNHFSGVLENGPGNARSVRIGEMLWIPVSPTSGQRVGTVVEIFVRPEHVKIAPGDETGMAMFEGAVREVIFLGESARCHVLLAGDLQLMANVPMSALGSGGLANGSPIRLGWPIEASMLFSSATT
jgi:spermidine/putrescine ABC transporter ATP-binding subunit